MSSSQVLRRLLKKTAASAPFTPNPSPSAMGTPTPDTAGHPAVPSFQTPNPSTMPTATPAAGLWDQNKVLGGPATPGDAAVRPPVGTRPASFLDKAQGYGQDALNASKGFANKEIAAGKSEYANQIKPEVQQLGQQAQGYFKGLGSNPGQWAGAHPIATGVAGLGAVAMLWHLLHKKKDQEGQPKTAADQDPRALVGAGITDINGMARAHAHAGDTRPAVAPKPLIAPGTEPTPAPAPVAAVPPKEGLMDSAKDAANAVGNAAVAHPYMAGGATIGSAALLAYLLNRPSKKDRVGHVAPAAPAVA